MRRWTPRKVLLATTALVPLGIVAAAANPLGPNVVGGSATITGVGTANVTIHQTAPRTIINWHTFNIGAGETTRFVQPNASSIALNRVIGGMGPSQIYGNLTANGQVILVNPDGVMIGRGATINTGGFLASTHDISNANFMAGKYHFNIPGNPKASIVNEGTITINNATNQGFAALVAPGVRNSGTITASYGTVALASSGTGYTLDLYGDKLISLAVNDSIASTVIDVATGKPLNSLVKNTGTLSANGGRVELTAAQARTVVDSVINNRGVIEARSVGQREGKIVLGASTKVAGLPPQTVKLSKGKLDVSNANGKGGTIQVTGEKIVIKATSFDASGATGGGKVLIGGDTGGGYGHWAVSQIPQAKLEAGPISNATTVEIDAKTTINASATSVGSGGKVIVWADGDTTFAGKILARGGATSGDGGFVEVSGKDTLTYSGLANVGTTNGKAGTLLLDPQNGILSTVAGPGVILISSIVSALQNGNVIVTTGSQGTEAGDMFVNAPIAWSTAFDLWLEAHRHIYVNANITNTSGSAQNEIILQADKTGTGTGTVFFSPGTMISTSGEVHIAINATFPGVKYVSPNENFSSFVTAGAGFTQHMLVNSTSDMLLISNNLAGNYVLSRDIDMSGVTSFTPFGNYTGHFQGLGHTIKGLNITSAGSNVGLFESIGVNGEIHELVLKDFVVTSTATGGPVNLGTLAGTNSGLIDGLNVINTQINAANVSSMVGGVVGTHSAGTIRDTGASGTINVSGLTGVTVGGLIGTSNANVTRSFSLGTINADNVYNGTIGGLIGASNANISDVYSRGNITATNSPGGNVIGGLVGDSDANITRSYATGTTNTTGSTGTPPVVNSLVGIQSGGSVTESYYQSPGTGPGTAKTAAQLQGDALSTLFTGLHPWTRTAGYNGGYPHFTFETEPFRTGTFLSPASQSQTNQTPVIPDSVKAPPDFRNNPIDPKIPGVILNLASLTPPGGAVGTLRPGAGPQPGAALRSLAPVLPQRPTCGMGGQCTSFATLLPTGQYIPNQVVVQISQGASQQNVQQILAQMGLTVLGSQPLANGNNALNVQLPPGVSMRDVILRLEQNQVVALAQANMKYNLVQQVPAAIAPFTASTGDPAQYSMGKLHLNDAHRIASGNNIVVAVIDSEVDADHAELKGTISGRYDATDTQARAHSHGTAMAGAIVSRERLRGVAPGARILAIRAFSENQTSAESTTFHILKGIEYAVSQGARIINMSFAGPYDPSLEKALKDAAAKGVVLIAASGNAGPKSPPLWPGADPSAIAVTATDSGDKGFRQANRGPYISVSSPGVEILAPAPASGYQLSTGTSIATAHVSGVVALMLERDPTLTPADVRLILESTASDLGPKGRDQQFGWGLVNPAKALAMVDERKRQKGSSSAPAPVQR